MQEQDATGLIGRLKQVLGPVDSAARQFTGQPQLCVEDLPGLLIQVAPNGAILQVSRALAETLGAAGPASLTGRAIGAYLPAMASGSSLCLELQQKGELRDAPVQLLASGEADRTAAMISARMDTGGESVRGTWTGCLTLQPALERCVPAPASSDSEFLDGIRTAMQSQMELLLLQIPLGGNNDDAAALNSQFKMYSVVLPRLEAILALNTPFSAQPFDARASIAELCRAIGRLLDGAGVNLIFDVDPDFPRRVTADQDRVRTCLNLLLGAAALDGNPGEIIVRLALEDPCFLTIQVLVVSAEPPLVSDQQRDRQIELAQALAATADGSVLASLDSLDGPKYVLRMRASAAEAEAAAGPEAGAAPTPDRTLQDLRILFVGAGQSQKAVFSKWIERQHAKFLHAAAPADARGACSGVPPDIAILDLSVCGTLPEFLAGVPFLGLRSAVAPVPEWCQSFIDNPVFEEDLLDAISSVNPSLDPAEWEPQTAEDSGAARILSVEDNPVNQRIIQKMLVRLGYEVDLASNGLEALVAIRKRPHDAILMDWEMPVMDGLEATAAIRGLQEPLCRIPIIAVTAHAIPGDRETCLRGGMDDYLVKPVNVEVLRKALGKWLPRSPRLLRRKA